MNNARAGLPSLIAYCLTVLVFFAGSFFPESRTWGFNSWSAFLPGNSYYLLGAILIIGLALWWWSRSIGDGLGRLSGRTYWILAGAVTLISVAALYFLRNATHFLGDGYTLIALLVQDNPYIKARNFGGQALPYAVTFLFGERTDATVRQAYQIVSIASGALFVPLAFVYARRLFESRGRALLFALGVCAGGYSLQFFGYVEDYSVLLVLVLGVILSGLAALQNGHRRWLPLVFVLIATVFHVFGLVLLPAALYVLLRDTAPAERIMRWHRKVRWGIVAAILLAGTTAFFYLYETSYSFRFRFVPLWPDYFTADGYWLLSVSHIADLLNLLAFLIPCVAVLFFALGRSQWREYWSYSESSFMTLAIAASLFIVIFIDPKLGMPRDWDLMAFAAVPIMVLLFRIVLFEYAKSPAKGGVSAALLAALLSVAVLGSTVVMLTDAEIGLERFKFFLMQDRCKGRPGYHTLTAYLSERGRIAEAEQMRERFQTVYIERDYLTESEDAASEKNWGGALRAGQRARDINPIFYTTYQAIGFSYSRLYRPDSALVNHKIADALRPNDAMNLHGMGLAYAGKKQYDKAKELLWRATLVDTTYYKALVDLMASYVAIRDRDSLRMCLDLIIARPDSPADMFKGLSKQLTALGYDDLARRAAAEAAKRAVDSTGRDTTQAAPQQLDVAPLIGED
jgi:tetratricopeptide (TPR) repeat protein